jgi:hypothetical protein
MMGRFVEEAERGWLLADSLEKVSLRPRPLAAVLEIGDGCGVFLFGGGCYLVELSQGVNDAPHCIPVSVLLGLLKE